MKKRRVYYLVVSHYSNESINEFDSIGIHSLHRTLEEAQEAAKAMFEEDKRNGAAHDTVPYTLDDDKEFPDARFIVGEQEEGKFNSFHNFYAVIPLTSPIPDEEEEIPESPLYLHDAKYAREHGELEQYRESHKANVACKDKLEEAISNNFDGFHLDTATAMAQVRGEFSDERIRYVLANTIQCKDWDKRFNQDNRAWADGITIACSSDGYNGDRAVEFVIDRAHSCLVDGFVTDFRKEIGEG